MTQPFGVFRRPMTPPERDLAKGFFSHQRRIMLGVSILALAFAVAYILYPVFLVFIVAFGFVFGAGASALLTSTMRRALAKAEVVEVSGVATKLAAAKRPQSAGGYTLQLGPEKMILPLSVYDRFAPSTPGSLTYVDRVNLILAVNGRLLEKPQMLRKVKS